ncbi:MAG TPA: hypothetical protein VHR88_06065, partial [Solirubrobacteraceae bacterium]|nr:hypothetical protein [Solirubrobacteraceae bacterium]
MSNGSFTVPGGVTSVSVDVLGAKGGDNHSTILGLGGSGGEATGTVAVTPGGTLSVIVGGEGGDVFGPQGGSGGAGGGGDGGTVNNYGGAGGGGRSEVDRGSTQLLVAGGGGGSALASPSFFAEGWRGGGLFGLPQGGRGHTLTGGTQTQGGLGGPGASGERGANGTKNQGGNGAGTGEDAVGGGGGGGGFYGGGGGGSSDDGSANSYEGGGGGSGHLDPSVTGGMMATGGNDGAGKVTITYADSAPSTPTTSTGGSSGSSGGGASGSTSSAAPPVVPPPLIVALTEPSNAFSFARVRVGVHQLRLGFDYPGSGKLDVLVTTRRPRGASAASLRPGPHSLRIGRLRDSADGRETHTLRVPISHRGERLLARRGKLPVRISLVF